MIEICEKTANFNATSPRPAYEAKMILKKNEFLDVKIIEICSYVGDEEYEQQFTKKKRNTKYGKPNVNGTNHHNVNIKTSFLFVILIIQNE